MPTRLTHIVVDTPDPEALARWWAAALDYVLAESDPAEAYVVPPAGEPGVPLVFGGGDPVKAGKNRVHVDLASGSLEEQRATVERLLAAGATRLDIGQGDVPWAVLADPEGNEFCVLEPRERFRDTGRMAAVVLDALDPAALAEFYAAATGWRVTDRGERTVVLRAPSGVGPLLALVRTAEPHTSKNRWHLDVAGHRTDDRDAEVARLVSLGAKPTEIGQSKAPPGEVTWVVLADPEGNEVCVLRSR